MCSLSWGDSCGEASPGSERAGGRLVSDDPVDPVAAAARAAARQLAPMYDLPLEAGVEEALLGARTEDSPTQYLDPISLGILIVAIATLAYQIYSDRKKNGGKPT